MGTKVCAVEGCGKPVSARGLCAAHYGRWQREAAWADAALPDEDVRRFWASVEQPEEAGSCWRWRGRPGGRVAAGGRRYRPQQIAYWVLVGTIPPGWTPLPTCGERSCVNPAHLRLAPPEEWRARPHGERTHCPQGHPYDEANTVYISTGRRCLTCQRAYLREAAARRRAAREAREANLALRQGRQETKVVRLCSVEGCDRRTSAHGMCPMHYSRWKRYGDPLFVKRPDVSRGRQIGLAKRAGEAGGE